MPRKKIEEVVDGIYIDPTPITLGEEIKIKYKGLLADSGADQIYLHAGFGENYWDRVVDLPMDKTKDGAWLTKMQIDEPNNFNFCFHDSAGNWDNNYGRNWSYQVHHGEQI